MRMIICEHQKKDLITLIDCNDGKTNKDEFELYKQIIPRTFNGKRNKEIAYYKLHYSETCIRIEANYYVGIDWLIPNKKFVYVAPKVNTKVIEEFKEETEHREPDDIEEQETPVLGAISDSREVNYLQMYLEATQHPDIVMHTDGLLFIDWSSPEIEIEQKDDVLTPFLIVQYLNLLKQIVRKGLKKSYYQVEQNLQGKVKGKILVGQNIKTNVLKNRITNTLCSYQEFGIDTIENRFLKKILRFVSNYISNNPTLFKGSASFLQEVIGYCTPTFEKVSENIDDYDLKHIKVNVFFKEYKEAIKIGQYILKQFAYNISNTSLQNISIPPFWINMPKLFELYVYKKLLTLFPGHVNYHFSTYGNELDFLITKPGFEMVVDAKYKLHYQRGQIHQDIRQVSGYARLNKVYTELGIKDDRIIDCLIIYPDPDNGSNELPDALELKQESNKIKAYRNIYKVGVQLPVL